MDITVWGVDCDHDVSNCDASRGSWSIGFDACHQSTRPITRGVLTGNAEKCGFDRSACHDLAGQLMGQSDRDGKPHTGVGTGGGEDLNVDSDDGALPDPAQPTTASSRG